MDPSMQPLSAYSEVASRLAALAKTFGFEMEAVHVVPPRNGSPVFMQMGFHAVDPNEHQMLNAPKETGDSEFDALIAGAEEAEEEQRRAELRQDYETGTGLFEGFTDDDR